jgi:hypothetical protein
VAEFGVADLKEFIRRKLRGRNDSSEADKKAVARKARVADKSAVTQ